MASLDKFKKSDKTQFMKIDDGHSKEVQFLTEIENFEFYVEHSNPEKWFLTAECTYNIESDDGCYACEQKTSAWNPRVKVLIPVLHNGILKALTQSTGANSVIHSLSEYYMKNSTILDTKFVISRNGNGKRTAYRAVPLDNSELTVYNKDVSLSQLRKSIDYNQQAKYYK